MRSNHREPAILFFTLLLALAAAAGAQQPVGFGGSYSGEVVVHSVSSTRVVVAVDEHGAGQAERVFFADTAEPVGPFAARSAVARVEYSAGELVVMVPRERRVFRFRVGEATIPPQLRRKGCSRLR